MKLKICSLCKKKLTLDMFGIHNQTKSKLRSRCKKCNSKEAIEYQKTNIDKKNVNNRKYKQTEKGRVSALRYKKGRRAAHRNARPLWNNKEIIDFIYAIAKCYGKTVDHIVPLKSYKVCGLHTQDNLIIVDSYYNRVKGNRYWPNM